MVMAVLCSAALIFVALVLLWVGQTSSRVYQDGANALAIRAVLRANVDEVAAEKLAGRIRASVPGISIDLINESLGRSLLALQEPWIAQMPDFEVTPLPILLEMRHPNLLTNPEEVLQFVGKLGSEPEVDFVAYNETAHDKLAKLADGTAAIENHALHWALTALALAGFVAMFICARAGEPRMVAGSLVLAGAVWLISWLIGALVFRGWESSAITLGDWERVARSTYVWVGVAALGITAAATGISSLLTRLGR